MRLSDNCDNCVTIGLQLRDNRVYWAMMIVQIALFVLALAVTVVAFGATAWVSCKPPQTFKTH